MLTPLIACAALAQEEEAPVALAAPPAAVMAPAIADDRTVGFRITVVPGFGLAADPNAAVHGFSTGFLSVARSVEGADVQVIASWVDGPMTGVQGSTIANVAADVEGAQLTSGINWARGRVDGTQLSAVANIAGDVDGVQGSSGINIASGDLDGVQGSACLNIAAGDHSEGLQATAGVNIANQLSGMQAAPLNIARGMDGFQLGIVNIGGDVKGVQLGIVNIARTSDVSIAPINLIGDGLHRVDVWTSESAVGTAALKFGSKNVYTLLGVGWVNPSQQYWTYGGGFGVHLTRDPLWLEVDGTAWNVARANRIVPGVHAKLRTQIGIDILPHLAPFAGVSMNVWTGMGSVVPRAIGVPSGRAGNEDGRVVAWPGFHAGISF